MTTKTPLLEVLENDETYLMFTADHDKADAERKFTNRFGYRPDAVLYIKDKMFLGPVEPKSLMPGLA